MNKMIIDPTITYSHAQLMRDIQRLKTAFSGLIRSEKAGLSVEKRELPLITMGTGKRTLFLCGAHHAREYISSAYLMYTINVLAQAAQSGILYEGYDIAKLLSQCTLAVMPMVNPDGVALVQGGLKAVQDKKRIESMVRLRSRYEEWKANINGVDLGRQYPALWEQKYVVINAPASELYNGSEPASEPEVRAVIEVCNQNDIDAAISFHTKGEVIYWADANTHGRIPHDEALAERLSKVSGYALMPMSDIPGVFAAGFENWFRQAFLRPGLLVELTPMTGGAMPHHDRQFFQLVWGKAKLIVAEALRYVGETDE